MYGNLTRTVASRVYAQMGGCTVDPVLPPTLDQKVFALRTSALPWRDCPHDYALAMRWAALTASEMTG